MEKIIQNIISILGDGFTEHFCESVLNRLTSFGYEVKEDDVWQLCFSVQKVKNHIMSSCNVTDIPDGLFHVAVDMVCGEFLFAKKQTNQLQIEGLDLDGVIASVSAGDTSVSFDNTASDEGKFNQLLNYLMTKGEGDFVCYRKLKW